MHARLARYSIPVENLDQVVTAFQEAGVKLQELEGLIGGYLLVNAEEGTTMTLTLWDDQRTMEMSETRAATLRFGAIKDADGSIESVGQYEVALEFGGHTRDLRD